MQIVVTPPPAPPPKKSLPLLLAGGAGGLLLVAVIGIWLISSANSRPAKVAEGPPVAEAPVASVVKEQPVAETNPIPEAQADANPLPEAEHAPVPPPVKAVEPPAEKPVESQPVAAVPAKSAESKPAPKPEPKAAAKPPAVPAKPFSGFAATVNLPAANERAPAKLGPVNVPEEFICVVHLLGGETACKSKHILTCDAADRGKAERAWDILAAADRGESAPTPVARIALQGGQLHFHWTEAAAEHPAAGGLRNCALKLAAGEATHLVALRKPAQAGPLAINYKKQTESYAVTETPKPDKVLVEFDVTTGKALPRPRFLGGSSVPAGNGELWIEFGLKQNDKFLKLQVETALDAKGLTVTSTPWVQVTGQPKPVALTDSNLKKMEQQLAQMVTPLETQLISTPKTQQGKKHPVRAQVEQQLAAIREAQTQLQQLKELEPEFEKGAKLKVRAYHAAGETLVDLVLAK